MMMKLLFSLLLCLGVATATDCFVGGINSKGPSQSLYCETKTKELMEAMVEDEASRACPGTRRNLRTAERKLQPHCAICCTQPWHNICTIYGPCDCNRRELQEQEEHEQEEEPKAELEAAPSNNNEENNENAAAVVDVAKDEDASAASRELSSQCTTLNVQELRDVFIEDGFWERQPDASFMNGYLAKLKLDDYSTYCNCFSSFDVHDIQIFVMKPDES